VNSNAHGNSPRKHLEARILRKTAEMSLMRWTTSNVLPRGACAVCIALFAACDSNPTRTLDPQPLPPGAPPAAPETPEDPSRDSDNGAGGGESGSESDESVDRDGGSSTDGGADGGSSEAGG
jgi:hypothetical protein